MVEALKRRNCRSWRSLARSMRICPGHSWEHDLADDARLNQTLRRLRVLPFRECLTMFDWLVVGAGFAGSVLAERSLRSAEKQCCSSTGETISAATLIDWYDEAGILVHRYGPHIFHTNAEVIVDYLSQFTAWRPTSIACWLRSTGSSCRSRSISTRSTGSTISILTSEQNGAVLRFTARDRGRDPERRGRGGGHGRPGAL